MCGQSRLQSAWGCWIKDVEFKNNSGQNYFHDKRGALRAARILYERPGIKPSQTTKGLILVAMLRGVSSRITSFRPAGRRLCSGMVAATVSGMWLHITTSQASYRAHGTPRLITAHITCLTCAKGTCFKTHLRTMATSVHRVITPCFGMLFRIRSR